MNSRKIILAKNPKLANSRNSRKFLPKISRIFPLAKVSSAKVSSFKVASFMNLKIRLSAPITSPFCWFSGEVKINPFKNPSSVYLLSTGFTGILKLQFVHISSAFYDNERVNYTLRILSNLKEIISKQIWIFVFQTIMKTVVLNKILYVYYILK